MATVTDDVLTLRTNLAPTAMTKAIHDGRVASDIVKLDLCGPDPAQGGFKDMVIRHMYDCGELAIVTYLQAKCYGKPWVLLPAPVFAAGRPPGALLCDFGSLKPRAGE